MKWEFFFQFKQVSMFCIGCQDKMVRIFDLNHQPSGNDPTNSLNFIL